MHESGKPVGHGPIVEQSLMFAEAAEAPDVVSRQLAATRSRITDLVENLRRDPPAAIVTCARGSSDHAATYLRYLAESRLGILSSSAHPSVQSIYRQSTRLAGTLYVAVSQSGAGPDVLESAARAKSSGAKVLAIVNDENSPLASLADELIPLHAGQENAIAATKTFIATLCAMLHLVAVWASDAALQKQLDGLPGTLMKAWALDWQRATEALVNAGSLFVVSRGPGLAVAQEIALKLKEICGLHAEAFSAAEVRHGPLALVRPGFPVLALSQEDRSQAETRRLVADLQGMEAQVFVAAAWADGDRALPVLSGHDPAIQLISMVQTFYRFCVHLAIARGLDPDVPRNLSKVTRTV